jgi:hypothetical protein
MAIVKRSSIPEITKAEKNRGERANSGVGDVSGGGSGAGGSGGPEEYDSDPQAGGGTFPPASPPPKGDGADAPNHGSR